MPNDWVDVAEPTDVKGLIKKYFPENAVNIAIKVAQAESSFDSTADNINKNKTKDSGLFQINDINIPKLQDAGIITSPDELYDPETNVKAAAFLHSQEGFAPWSSSQKKWGKEENIDDWQDVPTPEVKPSPINKSSGINRGWDIAKGIIETPLAIGTGMVGGLAGLAGSIGAGITGKTPEEAKAFREYVTKQYSYQPTSKTGKGAMDILSTAMIPFGIPRKMAEKAGGEQWGNVADVAMMGLLPKVPSAVKKLGEVPYKTGKLLFRKTLQPAGTVAETKAITETGYNPPISGEGVWNAIKNRFKTYDSTMSGRSNFYKDLDVIKREASQVIAKNQGKTIRLEKMLAPLDETIKEYASNTELPATNKNALLRSRTQVEREMLSDYPDGNIPIGRAQKFKTTLYKRAENAYGEVKKAMSPEAIKALARGAREELETAMPEIGPVNRRMKPYLEFEDALDKSIVRIKNEKFSITNTIFNNDFLLGKLAKVFKALSPKHPLATPGAIKSYLYAKKNVNFEEAFAPEPDTSYVKGIPGQYLGYEGGFTGKLPIPTTKALGYDPNIYKQRQIGYNWETMANVPDEFKAVLVNELEGRFRAKGLTPSIWRKDVVQYPKDIQEIIGQASEKLQIPDKITNAILEKIIWNRKHPTQIKR